MAAISCVLTQAASTFNFDNDAIGTATQFTVTANRISATFLSPGDPGAGNLSPALSVETKGEEIVKVETLQPFTHIAHIPVDVDLASIRFERVKSVNAATGRRAVENTGYCEHLTEPGGSMFCPATALESPTLAYEVSCSYKGQPMASDDSGGTYFTFSAYFHPDHVGTAPRTFHTRT